MGLDQAIRVMTPEIAAKLAKWQDLGGPELKYDLISKRERDSIEDVWRGRKENHIRQAIEDLTGTGAVNCGYLFMGREIFEGLVEKLGVVSGDHSMAASVLPTQDGFFFGSTEYDEYYFQNVERELLDFQRILEQWDESKVYAYWEWW